MGATPRRATGKLTGRRIANVTAGICPEPDRGRRRRGDPTGERLSAPAATPGAPVRGLGKPQPGVGLDCAAASVEREVRPAGLALGRRAGPAL